MPDTKKSILQRNHRSKTLYSGFVTAVTHKTIVVFTPAHDVEMGARPSQYIRPERLSNLDID